MSALTTAAALWPARVAERETLPNPNGPSATAARARTNADWPALRVRIFDAIASIQAELANVTVGTEGTSSFGQFQLTTKTVPPSYGVVEDINVSLKTTSTPILGGLSQILVTDNYRIQIGPYGADISYGWRREYDIGELLAGDVASAMRFAITTMMR